MHNFTWGLLLILFVCTLGIFSFEVTTPEGTIKFSGWLGKVSDDVDAGGW